MLSHHVIAFLQSVRYSVNSDIHAEAVCIIDTFLFLGVISAYTGTSWKRNICYNSYSHNIITVSHLSAVVVVMVTPVITMIIVA